MISDKVGIKPSLFSGKYFAKKVHVGTGVVIHDDALKLLAALKPSCADIVFLDPPFNLGKSYSGDNGKLDSIDENIYRYWMKRIIDRSIEILKPGGALYLYHVPRACVRSPGPLLVRVMPVADRWPERAEPAPST